MGMFPGLKDVLFLFVSPFVPLFAGILPFLNTPVFGQVRPSFMHF